MKNQKMAQILRAYAFVENVSFFSPFLKNVGVKLHELEK